MSAQPQRGSKHVVEAETKVCLNPTTSKHYGIHVVNCTHVNKTKRRLHRVQTALNDTTPLTQTSIGFFHIHNIIFFTHLY